MFLATIRIDIFDPQIGQRQLAVNDRKGRARSIMQAVRRGAIAHSLA